MKKHFLIGAVLAAASLTFAGCGVSTETPEEIAADQQDSVVSIGRYFEIDNSAVDYTFREQSDALAANGLYYATWVDGSSSEYENSDGDTVDLYESQLYLLIEESPEASEAADNMNSWLDRAESNYEVIKKEDTEINGITYTLLTYNCVSENNPYDHGVSLFGTNETSAICIELTCLESYTEDLNSILQQFMDAASWVE